MGYTILDFGFWILDWESLAVCEVCEPICRNYYFPDLFFLTTETQRCPRAFVPRRKKRRSGENS